jgi:hypothetical protein
MPICPRMSFDGLVTVHPKLFEYVLSVLCLADECALLELFDFKSKEILQFPHHGNLKSLYHNPTKLFTR